MSNYITKKENTDFLKEDEHKLKQRGKLQDSIKNSIDSFFSSLDKDFQPPK